LVPGSWVRAAILVMGPVRRQARPRRSQRHRKPAIVRQRGRPGRSATDAALMKSHAWRRRVAGPSYSGSSASWRPSPPDPAGSRRRLTGRTPQRSARRWGRPIDTVSPRVGRVAGFDVRYQLPPNVG